MKTKISILALIMFLLASCASAVNAPTVAPITQPIAPNAQTQAPPATQTQQVISWPGLHSGWMDFEGAGGLPIDFTYDPTGYLWALANPGIARWDLKTY